MRADKIFKNYREFNDWVFSCKESNDLDFWDCPDFPKDCMHLGECECEFMYLVDPISNKTFKISGRYIYHHHTPGYDFEHSYIEEIQCKTLKEYYDMWLD